ncbi:S8 family serine peptidase [Actinoplanes sp. NPDC051475]|uniref:S8 family serine peptidase n=1 Tax=Actinoplanes sp. NPDC051475 TaxID=3157225 RepID=UPI00344BBB1B
MTLSQVRTVIGAGTGTAAGLTGKGVGVALIDTGVAPVAGLPAAKVVNGPDLSFESQAPNLRYLDTFGHGTHMAGIIVGNDAATGTKGLAPDVKLTSIKVGTANGAVDVSQVMAAVDWVVEHRNDDPANPIKVINLSYGSGGTPNTWDDPLGFAVEKAWQAGILVVAAAGNDGNDFGALANPASDEFILTVGAAATKGTTALTDDTLATFTNLPKAGKQINVLAPGVSIMSLRDGGSYIDTTYPTARVGETLFRGSGTSQATAVTSAAAALLLQARPTATPDQLKDWLIKSSARVPNGVAANLGLQEINVNAAIALTTTTQKPTWNPSNGSGTLDNSRGSSRVVFDTMPLAGQRTVWGPVTTATWAARSGAGDSWSGGSWMGFRLAGDGWTGTSWASRTWAASTWSNSAPWTGAGTTWSDPAWAGRSWTGRSWTAGSWTGRSWASDDWSSAYWG